MARPVKRSAQIPAPSIWSPTFVALLFMNFFMAMGQTTTGTVLPLFARDLGATTSLVGFVSGAFAVTALAVRPFAGPAFDSFSKKRLLLVAVAVITAAMASYSFAQSVPAILVGRFVHGLGMGCSGPLGMALVSETLPPQRLGSGVSIYALAQAAAQAVGPAFGLWFSDTMGYSLTFLLTAAFMAASWLTIAVFVKEPYTGVRPPYRLSLSRAFARKAVGPAFVLMLLSGAFSCTSAFMAIYGKLLGVQDIGLFFTVYAVCLLVTRPLFGKLSDRVGTTKMLVPAILCFGASYVLASRALVLQDFLVTAVVAACGFGVCTPLLQALVFKCVPESARGSASNTTYTGLDLGFLLGPTAGGMVVEAFLPQVAVEAEAYANMWIAMLVPIAVALLAFLVMRKRLGGR